MQEAAVRNLSQEAWQQRPSAPDTRLRRSLPQKPSAGLKHVDAVTTVSEPAPKQAHMSSYSARRGRQRTKKGGSWLRHLRLRPSGGPIRATVDCGGTGRFGHGRPLRVAWASTKHDHVLLPKFRLALTTHGHQQPFKRQ